VILETLIVGPTQTNCYLIGCDTSKEAAIIDPGGDPDIIKKALEERGLSAKFIINTHGHADHIGANQYFNLPVYIHKEDADFLADPEKNLSSVFGWDLRLPKADRLLDEGDVIEIGGITLKVLHTPGHTPGGISLLTENIAFTGDTLFADGVGRTDFQYSDEAALFKAIKEKLLTLPDDTIIYPGHGPSSTIGRERAAFA